MSTILHIDPVVEAVDAISGWMWRQVVDLSGSWMSSTVLHPLSWPSIVTHFYNLSRDLAGSLVVVIMVSVSLKSMWPQLSWSWRRMSAPLYLERLVTAGFISLTGLWLVKAALDINNGVVLSLLQEALNWTPGLPATGGALSPLVVLLVGSAMLLLMLYLGLFYAVRTIEIFLLTAAIPWFALWWAAQDNDSALTNIARELGVVIFIQSFHAGAFWLAVHLMSSGHQWGMAGVLMELALLWYMTKLPGQLRRLVGIAAGGNRLWR